MDIKRIVVSVILMATLLAGAAYAVWGDWDRSRIIGAERPTETAVSAGASGPSGAGRDEFAEALQDRFDSFTSVEHAETCLAVRNEGLDMSIAYIRERYYAQPGGPRMPFYDDIAERILLNECLTV